MDLATLDRSIEDCDVLDRILLAAPPERFDMGDWYSGSPTGCGTSACVAGHAALNKGACKRWGIENEHAWQVPHRAIPAIHAKSVFNGGAFVYAVDGICRSSESDDAVFAPTPAECEALGRPYAFGLAEREAARNRIAIVRRSLVLWRAALVAQASVAPQPAAAEVGVGS